MILIKILGGIVFGVALLVLALPTIVHKAGLHPEYNGEAVLGMRLDSTRSWPRALTIGAANDTALTRKFGQEVGNALRGTGVQVNFAPVVDVNSNPLNPVIRWRLVSRSSRL